MTNLSGPTVAFAQPLFSSSATQQHTLGEQAITNDGRKFVYAKAGAVALVSGTLLQAPAELTNHQNLTPTANSAGDTSITVTLGNTAATANYYAGGYVLVTVTPDVGRMYRIKSHPAANASASLTLQLEEPIVTAWSSATRVDLIVSPFSGVVINPSSATSGPSGAAFYPLAVGEYGWIQTWGPCSLLSDGGSTVGTNVSASNATAGAVEAAVTAQAAVGFALTGVATTENGAFFLTIG